MLYRSFLLPTNPICSERALACSTYSLLLLSSALASIAICIPSYLDSYPNAEWQAVYERDFFDGQRRAIGILNVWRAYL
jgi:hypothetical protein